MVANKVRLKAAEVAWFTEVNLNIRSDGCPALFKLTFTPTAGMVKSTSRAEVGAHVCCCLSKSISPPLLLDSSVVESTFEAAFCFDAERNGANCFDEERKGANCSDEEKNAVDGVLVCF